MVQLFRSRYEISTKIPIKFNAFSASIDQNISKMQKDKNTIKYCQMYQKQIAIVMFNEHKIFL